MKNSRFDNYLLKGRKLSLEPLESRALLSANPAFCGPPSYEQWLASDSRADVVCVVSAAETEPTDYCLVSNRVAELLQPGPPSLGQYEFIREVLRGLKEERVFDDGAFGAWLSDSDSYGFDSSLALIAEHIGSTDSDSESNANLEPDADADALPDDDTEPDVDAEPNANPNSESGDNPEVNDESDVDDDESDDSRVPRDRSGGENWENFNISLVNLHTSADQNAFNVVNPIMECRGLASPSSFVDFNEFDYDYALVELPAPPLYYECHATATADTGGINSQFVILKKVGDSFEQPTTLDYSGGSNLLYIVPIKNSLTSNMTITIDLYTPILPGVSGGNQEQEVISSISITVIKSRPRVSVSWQQDEANGAPLTASPQGGLRIYPEQENIYAYSLKNRAQLKFQLSELSTAPTSVFYRIVDPDNYISLGSGQTTDNNFAPNDNHLGSLDLVEGGNCTFPLTYDYIFVVVVPANTDSVTITVQFTTSYAGDNFIVFADTDSNTVAASSLGTTKDSRYSIVYNGANSTVSQTQLLTVWRTLWIETDVMSAPPTLSNENPYPPSSTGFLEGEYYDPISPVVLPPTKAWYTEEIPVEPYDFDLYQQPAVINVSLANNHLAIACITITEITDSIIREWKGELYQFAIAEFKRYTDISQPFSSGRDLELDYNTESFWLGHCLSVVNPTRDRSGDNSYEDESYLFGYAEKESILLFDECIRDCIRTCGTIQNKVNLDEARQRVFYHEALHYFLGPHYQGDNKENHYTNTGIMSGAKSVFSSDCNISLSPKQIWRIQQNLTYDQNGNELVTPTN